MSLVFGSYYYGLPKDQIAALETVAQATVDRLFALTEDLLQRLPDKHVKSFGDADYNMLKKPHNTILYRDNSAGWWAVLQVERWAVFQADQSFQDRVYFRVFARRGTMPKWVQAGKFEANDRERHNAKWERLETDFLYGRADLFLKVSRDPGEGWYGPLHLIDYQHPLLFNLQNAVDQINRETT